MDGETYLGDGLYASFDGYQFCLRAPRSDGDHLVYLERPAWEELKLYVERTMARLAAVKDAE